MNQSCSFFLTLLISVIATLNMVTTVGAQTDTTFTYQGLLTENGSPVTAPCDLRFRLFDSASGGNQIGISQTMTNVPISNGRFTAQLDFGLNAFDNSDRWLDILYRCPAGVGSYLILTPRQPITRSPYAIQTRGIVVDANENVGIGSPAPADDLHIHRNQAGIRLQDDNDPLSYATIEDTGPTQMKISKVTFDGGAVVDINPLPLDGDSSALVRFFRNTNTTGSKQVQFLRGNNSSSPSASIGVNGADSFFQAHGGDVVIGSGAASTSKLVTPVLQITGGSDFSEMFNIGEGAKPGMVVVIDPDHPGRLVLSTSPFDRKVAGIISGAGGVATGMTMGHSGTIADGQHPVALSGRVYCLVDSSELAIEPGDMLTTSSTPGHAMKVTDVDAANGAIIGKAMTSLEKNQTGLVLVLVNLQ